MTNVMDISTNTPIMATYGPGWTSTLPGLDDGYCWHFVVNDTPEVDDPTRRPMKGQLLECSKFVGDWSLSWGVAENGSRGTLWGYEFVDPLTGKENEAFPVDPGSDHGDVCELWMHRLDRGTSDPFAIYVYRTDAWSREKGIPKIDDRAPVDLTVFEGVLVFHGPEISPH